MQSEAQTIARLKSMIFLIEEALRIADEGDSPMLGAKLSDCIDCLQIALAQVTRDIQAEVAADRSTAMSSPNSNGLSV